jgi:diguanylate cyclase (GGDEF)-like protein
MSASVVLLILTALTNCLMLVVLGSLARSGITGIREAIRGAALVLVSLVGVAAQPILPPILGIVLTNFLMAAGVAYFYAAVLLFFGRDVPYRVLAGAVIATTLGIVLFWYVWRDTNTRILIVSILHSLLMGATAYAIQRNRPRDRPGYPYLFALSVAWFEAVGHAVRGLVYGVRWEVIPDLAGNTPLHIIFLSIGVLVVPSLTLGMVLMVHDRMLQERESEANTDSLTGTLARKAWWLLAEKTLARAARGDLQLSLLMLDIDRFKDVNDTYGHALGDAVLKHFGKLGAAALREEDIIGRLGGEEFAVLFPDTRIDAAAFATSRLLDAVRNTGCVQGDRTIAYTFSGGLAEWDGEESMEMLMQRADRALYTAKMEGRDRVVVRMENRDRLVVG